MRHRRVTAGVVAGFAMAVFTNGHAANAAYPHTVQPGESLYSIALANNFTTRTVAAYNGLPEAPYLLPGDVVQIPTDAEGVSALWTAGIVPGSPIDATGAGYDATGAGNDATGAGYDATGVGYDATGSGYDAAGAGNDATGAGYDATGVGYDAAGSGYDATGASTAEVATVPEGLGLAPGAAESWEAMRQEAIAAYGIDLYSGGPLSGFRSYEDQAYLYDLYLSGVGAPANPPGTSWHELGLSVDLADPAMRQVVDQIGWKYGWTKVHGPSEWWHVDYVGG